MPLLDKIRIQGLGSGGSPPAWRCPAGHELLRAVAEQGMCDRCCRPVREGEAVLDCRRCNWYLCKDCLQAEVDGVWGGLAMLFGAASREMAEVAMEAKTFVSELQEHFSDVKERMSCQPAAKSRITAAEDVEVPPPASGQTSSEDDDAAAGTASRSATDTCRNESPPRADHTDLCDEQAEAVPPAQPVMREFTDLIDLGQHDLLDMAAEGSRSPPVGHAAKREALDLLDLPGPAPKLETQAAAAPSGAQQPWIQTAQAGA